MSHISIAHDDDTDSQTWLILCNADQQYALWPVISPVPDGWLEVGPEGSKAECLAWIDAHWTDMRPLALQQA